MVLLADGQGAQILTQLTVVAHKRALLQRGQCSAQRQQHMLAVSLLLRTALYAAVPCMGCLLQQV